MQTLNTHNSTLYLTPTQVILNLPFLTLLIAQQGGIMRLTNTQYSAFVNCLKKTARGKMISHAIALLIQSRAAQTAFLTVHEVASHVATLLREAG